MSDMEKREEITERGLKTKVFDFGAAVLPSVAIIAIVALLVNLFFREEIAVTQLRHEAALTTINQVTETQIEKEDTPIGLINVYTFALNREIPQGANLAFYTVHQYTKVYLGGQLVYSLQPKGEHRITKTLGSNWVMIPLYEQDGGKEVRIEITPAYESFKDREMTFLLGSSLEIFKNRLSLDLPQIVLGGIAILTGVVFLCIAVYSLIRKRPGKKLASLGLFSIMLGIWKINDTRFTPFMDGGEPVLYYYIAIAMLMFAILPLAEWTKGSFSRKGRKILDIYEIAMALLTLLLLALQWLSIYDFRETLPAIHISLAAGAALLVLLIAENRALHSKEEKLPLPIRLAFLCVAGVVADVITFYIKGNSSGLLFSLTSLILYIMIMGIHTMSEYSRQQVKIANLDRELAEQKHKLTDSRIKMMLSQIRSHFIFNVLATISTYCKIDPETADRALVRFSRYLRRNIKTIEEDDLIEFSTELEQLEDYVALEQLRFADQITFEKDIETTSFFLPPLTVQPLVENAIKHGFIEQGKSGSVRLRTERKGQKILITIMDDGAGFDPQTLQNAKSVGIRNVRYRIETMTGGSLHLTSEPGKGTTAVIEIPLKEEK